MKVSFNNNRPEHGVVSAVVGSSAVVVDGKDVIYSKIIMNGNEELLFSSNAVKSNDRIVYGIADMEGPKGKFVALWTTEARKLIEGPLHTPGSFKEGEEVKATVKIIDCKPRLKPDGSQSFYESKYGVMYHYTVTFEHEGKAILATAQAKEQNKNPFSKDETVDVMVSVKNGYVNVKKVAAPFGGKGFGGGGSKHDAWARVYAAHYHDARQDNDYATAKAMAIAAANEVIKKMEV